MTEPQFILTEGARGYPAGFFFTQVFETMLHKRDDSLIKSALDIWGYADTQNSAALDAQFPGWRDVFSRLVDTHAITEAQAHSELDALGGLASLPERLAGAFPAAAEAVREALAQIWEEGAASDTPRE